MASEEARQHAERLRYDYARRLRLLEERAARQGIDADPSTLIEIEDIKANIAGLDMIAAPAPAPEVRHVVRQHYDSYADLLVAQLGSFNRRLTDLEGQVSTVAQQNNAAQTWRLGITADVDGLKGEQAKEKQARQQGQNLNRYLLVAILVLMVIVLAVVVN